MKEDIKSTLIYTLRNWQAHSFGAHSQDANELTYIERAYQGAMTAHRQNEPYVRLFSLAIFMAVEAGHLDIAATMLDKAMEYRKHLREYESFYFGNFLFLQAYLAVHKGKARAVKKHTKQFMAHVKAATYSPHYDVMLAKLHIAQGEYEEAHSYLARAYAERCNSVYLYEGLFQCYAKGVAPQLYLLPALLNAATNGADISNALESYESHIYEELLHAPAKAARLYTLTQHPLVLKALCMNHINNNDYSLQASQLYRQAVDLHIDLRELGIYLVKSSFANRIEEIPTYALGQVLSTVDMELPLAIYVYFLLLTDPAHARLRQSHDAAILATAKQALERKLEGRRVNALYQFLLHKGDENAATPLKASLTQFELTRSSDVKYVYISHPTMRGSTEHAFDDDSHRIVIDAIEGFSYVCLGAGRRKVIDESLVVRHMVPLVDFGLYRYFFDRGDRRIQVLSYLASYYLQNPGADAIPVYEAFLEEGAEEKDFRMQVLAALGRMYFGQNQTAKGTACYADVDTHAINMSQLVEMLCDYRFAGMHQEAHALLCRHYMILPPQETHNAIHWLIDIIEAPPQQQELANIAYGMLPGFAYASKGVHNEDPRLEASNSEPLFSYVLTHHQASQTEWKALERRLITPRIDLDHKILAGDMWMHHIDPYTEKAFTRLFAAKKAPEECMQFVNLATYKILSQDLLPQLETIHTLEKAYENLTRDLPPRQHNQGSRMSWIASASPRNDGQVGRDDRELDEDAFYLLLALCHVYQHHKITTLRSDKFIAMAIDAQAAAGILLPSFKEAKAKPHPYVEKYQPFLFRSEPQKDIRLNYRFSQTAEYHSIPMEHLRYGIFTAKLPLFYNETVEYYFSDEMPTGSIATPVESRKNTSLYLNETHQDTYYAINNAVIYEQMFRHEQVEEIVDGLVGELVEVSGGLL